MASTGNGSAQNEIRKLDDLIAESERSLKRLDDIAKQKHRAGYGQRVQQHVKKNSSHLINIALAGSVFVVALGRLNDKYAYQTLQVMSRHLLQLMENIASSSSQGELAALQEKLDLLKRQKENCLRDLQEVDRFVGSVEGIVGVNGGGQLGAALRAALQSFKSQREQRIDDSSPGNIIR